MKKIVVLLILLLSIRYTASSQEYLATDLNRSNFKGIITSGGMEKIILLPYTSEGGNGKTIFNINRINYHTLQDEDRLNLELPASYELITATYAGGSYVLICNDKSKKEDILITAANNNIIKKVSIKSKGNRYFLAGTANPESFLLISINDKGGYTITNKNFQLENLWEKSFSPNNSTWNIYDISPGMEGISILRKETGKNGEYTFTKHMISGDNGEDLANQPLKNDSLSAYPTFFSTREGMQFTGGYYYNSGKSNGQADGIFMAMLSPEGQFENITKVPLSQVVEDLKSNVGSKLLDKNTAIIFTDGMMSHETQSLIMSGQVISRVNSDNKTKIALGDIVTLKFNLERGYAGAYVVKLNGQNITLEGSSSNVNTPDLGVWLNRASLLQLKGYVPMPGNPIVSFSNIGGGDNPELCYKNAALKVDTNLQLCLPIADEPLSTENTFVFTQDDFLSYPVLQYGTITDKENFSALLRYSFIDNMLKIQRVDIPQLEKMMIITPPEEPEPDEPEQEEMTPGEVGEPVE